MQLFFFYLFLLLALGLGVVALFSALALAAGKILMSAPAVVVLSLLSLGFSFLAHAEA
jgi:hypothetical protein